MTMLNLKRQYEAYRSLAANFVSLVMLQGTNYLLPLLVAPYLIRTIGVTNFGKVSFAQAVITYFSMVADYGFNITATKKIAVYRDDEDATSRIVSSVMVTKLLLCAFCLTVLFVMVGLVPKLRNEWPLYAFGAALVVGQTLLPIWFFQGREQMKYITYLNLFSKVMFATLIFVVVRAPNDYAIVPLLYGAGNVLSGLVGLVLMRTQFSLAFHMPSASDVRDNLVDSWHVFLTNFAISIHGSINIIILGMFASDTVVGYFSIAEKVYVAMKQLVVVLFQAVYPFACRMGIEADQALRQFFRNLTSAIAVTFSLMGAVAFFGAPAIVTVLAGKALPVPVTLLRMLSFIPLIIALNVPSYQMLLIHDMKRTYTSVYLSATALNVALNLILAYSLGVYGTIIAILCTELFVTTASHIAVWRQPSAAIFGSSSGMAAGVDR